jgi:hypothetical protein
LNPFDVGIQTRVAQLRHQKQIADNFAARGAQIKARLHWLEIGDQASKEFFSALRARHSAVGIKRIREGQNLLCTLPDILQAFVHHYEQVFTAQAPSAASEHALHACLAVTPSRLAPEQYNFCEQKLTLSDLKEAVDSMANDKAPGCDGFPCEFYKAFWDDIGPDLHKVYLEAFAARSLGTLINKGNIKFIPKSGDPEEITNWRPITLLNVSYKIIAKALSLKVRHLLPQIIRPEQTGFIKSRYILDNIIAVWEGMEWARLSKQ